MPRVSPIVWLFAAVSCTGVIQDGPPSPSGGDLPGPTPTGGRRGSDAPAPPGGAGTVEAVPATGLRRLTRDEYRNTVQDLVGLDLGAEVEQLPNDHHTPFDNDYTTQVPSRALVEAARSLAEEVTRRVLADSALRNRTFGCVPTGAADGGCLRRFITGFGPRALRRPLTAAEIDRYSALQSFSVAANDFNKGASMVLRALLQDLELLYRVEIGSPAEGRPGLFELDGYEVASRLSYLLWGSMPDDTLWAAAAKNQLRTPTELRAAALRMLETPRGKQRTKRFHALWLDYADAKLPAALERAMQAETAALVERVLYTNRATSSWLDLFRSKESYLDKPLAAHYGLAGPASGSAWVSYGETGRRGLLSHATFLSTAAKFADTSPTQRGLHIREALMCQPVPPPPPDSGVNVDAQPASGNCKADRYVNHTIAGCASCHSLIDPLGFGLESYDQTGRYRTTEPGKPECGISGRGELVGIGPFRGPAELGDRLIESRTLQRCLTTQMYRFYLGRNDRPEEAAALDALATRFADGGHRFHDLLLDLVASAGFTHRLPE